jgi:predicted RNase H-like HicB family nuclease
MTSDLEQRAEELAARPYSVEIIHDETTTGEPIIVMSHPELPGCMAQGSTLKEAREELAEARKEYILSLLEDGLPVPGPATTIGTQGTSWRLDQVDGGDKSESDHDSPKPTIVSVVSTR